MAEKPILFNGPMVRAILDGRKTQTRRPVVPQPDPEYWERIQPGWYTETIIRRGMEEPGNEVYGFASEDQGWKCPFGEPGTLLWMRSNFNVRYDAKRELATWSSEGAFATTHGRPLRKCDGKPLQLGVKVGRFMPYWLSCQQWPKLRVTAVRVERVQDISHKDAVAEGVGIFPKSMSAQKRFRQLWDLIYLETYPWHENPWVWVAEFEVSDG